MIPWCPELSHPSAKNVLIQVAVISPGNFRQNKKIYQSLGFPLAKCVMLFIDLLRTSDVLWIVRHDPTTRKSRGSLQLSGKRARWRGCCSSLQVSDRCGVRRPTRQKMQPWIIEELWRREEDEKRRREQEQRRQEIRIDAPMDPMPEEPNSPDGPRRGVLIIEL